MKRILITVYFLFASVWVMAQLAPLSAATQLKKKEVTVLNWGGRTVTLLPTFWTPEMDMELLRQLTPEQVATVKAACQEKDWPDGFAVSRKSKHTHTTATLEEKLSGLKLYRIATFNNIRNGTNYGEMSVVLVSPEENADWDKELKWDKDIYFLFYSADLKVKE